VEKVLLHRNTPVVGARFVMISILGYVVNRADCYKRLGVPSLGLGGCQDVQVPPVLQVYFLRYDGNQLAVF